MSTSFCMAQDLPMVQSLKEELYGKDLALPKLGRGRARIGIGRVHGVGLYIEKAALKRRY